MTEFDARTTGAQILAGVDLTGRRMIVTGGASGIGAETVRALAGAGAEVTVATRDPDHAKPLIDEIPGRVRAAQIDLADLDSVAAFVREWDGPLDALVANAGIMALPTRQTTPAGWELQLATNFLGHFALAYGLHDALAAAGSARVITVSSGAHLAWPLDVDDPQFDRRPYEAWAAYGQSKTADVLLAVGIAKRWAADGIVANSLAPGVIHTKLQRHIDRETMVRFGAMDEDGGLLMPAHYKTAAEGASTTVLLAGSPTVAGVTGRYFEDNREAPVVPGGPDATAGVAAHALDPEAADRLWDLALPLVDRRPA